VLVSLPDILAAAVRLGRAMHINVRYKPDLMGTIRLNLYLSRKFIWGGAIAGVLAIIIALAAPPDTAALLYAIGATVIIEGPLLVLVQVYRHREFLLQEAEVTITSEGIERRTKNNRLRVAWDMVERVDEPKHQWLFITKRPTRGFGLRKGRLSQEQQAELAAFIEARHLNRQVRKMTPVQEAHYAVAYGVARSDLKPEAQAEYDRLVAERGPA
jgi:hypothetical protein